MFRINRKKEKLSHANTKEQRKDLNNAINSIAVSPDLQDKIDIVYESIGVNNETVKENKKSVYREEEDVEVL